MTFFKTCILCALLSLLAAFQASAQSIVGAWSIGDTTKEDSGVFVFFANGCYIHVANANFDGFERGTYTWNPATGAFTVNTLQDLNGDNGFSGTLPAGVTISISGATLTLNVPGDGVFTLTKVTGASPIVGAWGACSTSANNSVVGVFLPNGVYFEAEDGDSTPATGDPSGHDGIEHGTYTWNATTGLLTSSRALAPYVDTNGEWGLSHTGTQLTFHVSADGLTLNGSTGPADSFSLARVGAPTASSFQPVGGVWYDPNESGSGYGLDYKDGVLIVQVYSYLAGGAAQWYLGAGSVTNNVFQATLDKYTGGQCISCAYKGPALSGNDGNFTITFTSPTTADIALPGGRIGHIQRYFPSGAAQPASAPVGGVWWDPNESGSGYALDYQNGVLIVQVYSYLAGGAAQWYLGAGNVTNNVFQATLDKYTGGQCISCAYKGPALSGNDGNFTITFTSPTTAAIALPGGRIGHIQRYFP